MIFSNNGERCTAGSRILVQQSIYADFVQKFTERAKRISVGDPLDENTIVGPMISQAHLAKVKSYIELGPKRAPPFCVVAWTNLLTRLNFLSV